MIRAHLRRFIGGGLGGPLRNLPQESVARAKPALEPEHSTVGRTNPHPWLASQRGSVPLSSAGFAGATNPGGRFRKGGEAPLRVERTESPLACGPRAPPCSWTLLIALARAFLRQAPSRGPGRPSGRRGRRGPGRRRTGDRPAPRRGSPLRGGRERPRGTSPRRSTSTASGAAHLCASAHGSVMSRCVWALCERGAAVIGSRTDTG